MSNVAPPAEGARVIAAAFIAATTIQVYQRPDAGDPGAVLGYVNPGEAVDVVGSTPDGQWAMIGDGDGVIVGYASFDGMSQSRDPVQTTNPHVPDPVAQHGDAPVAPVGAPTGEDGHAPDTTESLEATKKPSKAKTPAKTKAHHTAKTKAAEPKPVVLAKVTVKASTQCKSLIAVTGNQSEVKTGCATPDGQWPIA